MRNRWRHPWIGGQDCWPDVRSLGTVHWSALEASNETSTVTCASTTGGRATLVPGWRATRCGSNWKQLFKAKQKWIGIVMHWSPQRREYHGIRQRELHATCMKETRAKNTDANIRTRRESFSSSRPLCRLIRTRVLSQQCELRMLWQQQLVGGIFPIHNTYRVTGRKAGWALQNRYSIMKYCFKGGITPPCFIQSIPGNS